MEVEQFLERLYKYSVLDLFFLQKDFWFNVNIEKACRWEQGKVYCQTKGDCRNSLCLRLAWKSTRDLQSVSIGRQCKLFYSFESPNFSNYLWIWTL